jgi:hypothetical protein
VPLTEDDLLISRALAAGWTAHVKEHRIPGDGFQAAWVWTWASPDGGDDDYEVWLAPRDALKLSINENLRELFRQLDVTAPADFDLATTLSNVLVSIEHDLRWIIDSSARDRALDAFSAAYLAIGAQMPQSIQRRLQSPALLPNND